MAKKKEALTYKQNMSKNEVYHVMKAIGLPLIAFAVGIFAITNFANFGTKIICPALGIMWMVGLVVAFLIPSMRKEVLNQTIMMCIIYCLVLLGLKMALGLVSGVSAEMIAASFNQSIPTSTGNVLPGYLQTFLWISSFVIPVGHIGLQGKRLMQFKKTQSLHKVFGQTRGMRDSKNGNSRMF